MLANFRVCVILSYSDAFVKKAEASDMGIAQNGRFSMYNFMIGNNLLAF